jgi:hypothetical protein
MSRRAWSSRLVNRCRISFAVNAMSPGIGSVWARSVVAVTARKAWASIARMVQRCHDVQRRTWCSSRPVNPLPAWKASSIVHLRPATATTAATAGSADTAVDTHHGAVLISPLRSASAEPSLAETSASHSAMHPSQINARPRSHNSASSRLPFGPGIAPSRDARRANWSAPPDERFWPF